MFKSQIPMKSQGTMSNEETAKTAALDIEIWSLGFHWDLGFEHWSFSSTGFEHWDFRIGLWKFSSRATIPAVDFPPPRPYQ
jgi:hypothetical protein